MTLKFTGFALFGQEELKIGKIYKKPKFCIVFTKFLLFLKFLIFEFLGHFWLIFGANFRFWHFGGQKVKNCKILLHRGAAV